MSSHQEETPTLEKLRVGAWARLASAARKGIRPVTEAAELERANAAGEHDREGVAMRYALDGFEVIDAANNTHARILRGKFTDMPLF